MTFEIILAPEPAQALRALPAHVRAEVRDAIEVHFRHEQTKLSKSRIKRLRGLSQPQFRLRVGDIRVFYDVTETAVEILAIVSKSEAQAWLDAESTATPGGGSG
jgi:mRNA interferase RelE/StbE